MTDQTTLILRALNHLLEAQRVTHGGFYRGYEENERIVGEIEAAIKEIDDNMLK